MNCNTALILAAGRGQRLRPITDTIPKPLIRAGRYRLIEYHLFNLIRAGITTVYVNRAHLREQFDILLPKDNFTDINLVYLDEPETPLETAGGIVNAFSNMNDERLIVVNGDIWTDYAFSDLTSMPENEFDNAHVVLVANPSHHRQGDFSISGDRLTDINNDGSYTFSGIGIYRRRMFSGLKAQYRKLAPLLHQQIRQGRISASIHRGEWMDVGTVARLSALKAKLDTTARAP